MLSDEQLKRCNPQAWVAKQARLAQVHLPAQLPQASQARPQQPPPAHIQQPVVSQARPQQPSSNPRANQTSTQSAGAPQIHRFPVPQHGLAFNTRRPPSASQSRPLPSTTQASVIKPAASRAGDQAQSQEPRPSPPRMQTKQPTAQRPQGHQAQVQQRQRSPPSMHSRPTMVQMAPSANANSRESSQPRSFADLEMARNAPSIPRTSSKISSQPTTPQRKETRIVPPQKEQHISPYKSPSPLPTDVEGAVRTNAAPRPESSSSSDELAHTPTRRSTSKGILTKSRGLSPILGLNTQPVRSDRSETPDSTSSLRSTKTPRSMANGEKGKPRASQEDIKNVCTVSNSPKFFLPHIGDKPQTSSDAGTVQTLTSVRSRSVEPKTPPRAKLHTRSSSDFDGRKAQIALSRTFPQGHNNRIGDAILQNEPNDETTPLVFIGDTSDQNNTSPTFQSTPPIDTSSPSPSASSSPFRNPYNYIKQK